MSSQLGDTTAKCRPFFDIFDANRIFLCRNIVDYINALWFFTFLTLLWWSIGTPVGLNMISIQRKMNNLKQVHQRAVERTESRGSRRRERERSASRERSTATANKPRPLKRSATEETLDMADDVTPPPRRERDPRSREREVSRPGEMTAPSTPARSRGQLQRSGTDDYDIDAGDMYGAAASNPAAVAAARHTPPRTAPPPPPPPASGMTNSHGSVRNVRWTTASDDEVVFEDAD